MVQALLHRLLSVRASTAAWHTIHMLDPSGRSIACGLVTQRKVDAAVRRVAAGKSVTFDLTYLHPRERDYNVQIVALEWRLHGEARLPDGARRYLSLTDWTDLRPGDTAVVQWKWSQRADA
jgi:hypothetical protein